MQKAFQHHSARVIAFSRAALASFFTLALWLESRQPGDLGSESLVLLLFYSVWAIANLADRWTFRVLVLPGLPLVRTGPYRYVNHPNYIAVLGELVSMALMMSAWITGPVMTLAFGGAILMRLKVETRALRDLRPR